MKLLNKIWPGSYVVKNNKADKKAIALPINEIIEKLSIPVSDFTIIESDFLSWQKIYFPEGADLFKTTMHKKLLELYVSYQLLNITDNDVYMDAAGGQYSYASRLNCREKIIQDIRLSDKLKSFHGSKVTYLDSSCDAIPLADQSLNKISCHHSIEHFRESADSAFMTEVSRLLAPGGKCVIVPVFLSADPLLISDQPKFKRWNEHAEWIIDETATLPGGAGSGHFSRIYSPESFTSRLLNKFSSEKFILNLFSVKMNGIEIPNEQLFMTRDQAIINYHYRTLVIERR